MWAALTNMRTISAHSHQERDEKTRIDPLNRIRDQLKNGMEASLDLILHCANRS